MSDLGALFYLELHLATQKFRQMLRQPARLALWMIFVAWFGAFVAVRMRHGSTGQFALLVPASASLFYRFVPAVYAAILGMQIRAGSRRPPAAFAYPADGRYLLGSRLSHVAIVFWLQLRETAFQGTRLFLALFFLSWDFAATVAGFFFASIALLSAFVIAYGVRLPIFVAQRRAPAFPFAWVGAALIAGGALVMLYPFALAFASDTVSLGFIAAHTAVFPPGTWIIAALTGNASAALLMVATACACIAIGSIAASDAYPEIWEASSRLYAQRALVASGRALWNREALHTVLGGRSDAPQFSTDELPSVMGDGAPSGALTVLWREWIAVQRSVGGVRWPLFWCAAAGLFGYLAGLATKGRSSFEIIVPVVALANIVIIIGSQSTISLAGELRRPIFWLGASRLHDRIAAWIVGSMLRSGPPLVIAAILGGVALHSPAIILAAGPMVAAGLFLVQTIGVATYVALPGRNDLRGPGFMLRVLATYLALGVPALGWVMVESMTRNGLAGAGAGLVIALAEAWVLLLFSAWRLEENAMTYAAAEER